MTTNPKPNDAMERLNCIVNGAGNLGLLEDEEVKVRLGDLEALIAARTPPEAARAEGLREALDDLQQAEFEYRLMHDRHGDGASATGRAWDLMKRAGDKARALVPQSPAPSADGELVERVARAISIPQHHTTWDILTWQEKDLFYMQADYAISAMRSATPQAEDGLREELAEVSELAKFLSRREMQFFRERNDLLLALKRTRLALNLVPANDKRFDPTNYAAVKRATDIIDAALASQAARTPPERAETTWDILTWQEKRAALVPAPSADGELVERVAREDAKLIAYLRRQGGQCNRQQPIVPVAGSELLKAADRIEALTATAPSADGDAMLCGDCGWKGSTAVWRKECKGFPCQLNARDSDAKGGEA